MGVNKVMLVGRLGKDPETSYSTGGLQVTKFSVATAEKYKGESHTEWHSIVVFGKLAEICSQYLHKGKEVFIEGKIRNNQWIDNDGAKRNKVEIIANEMQMLGSKNDSDSGNNDQSKSSMYENPVKSDPKDDNDIPF